MMISGIGRNKRLRTDGRSSGYAYTLLEICFVLFILALVAGMALPTLSGWFSEQKLRGPAGELELLARTARTLAIDRQQPYDIVLEPGSLLLAPSNANPKADADPTLPGPYRFSASITMVSMAWGESKFVNRPQLRWRFQPDGLCEPLRVKFLQDSSEIALTFDPLTATVSDEEYAFR